MLGGPAELEFSIGPFVPGSISSRLAGDKLFLSLGLVLRLWPGKAATHVEGQFVVTPSPTGQEGVILPDMPLRAHYERQRHDPSARGAFVVCS